MSTVRGVASMVWTRGDGAKVNINQDVDSLHAWVETKDLDFGDPRAVKALDEILLEFVDTGNLNGGRLSIYYRDNLEEALTLGETINIAGNPGEQPIRVPDAKYYRFLIEDLTVSNIWKLGAFTVWGSAEGQGF